MGKTAIGISWMKSLCSPWPSIGNGSLLHPAVPRRCHLHAQLRAAAKPSSQFPLHASGDSDHWDRATFYQYHREIGISPKQQALGFLLIIVGLQASTFNIFPAISPGLALHFPHNPFPFDRCLSLFPPRGMVTKAVWKCWWRKEKLWSMPPLWRVVYTTTSMSCCSCWLWPLWAARTAPWGKCCSEYIKALLKSWMFISNLLSLIPLA